MAEQNSEPRDRIDLRADARWRARVEHQAERFGENLSAYIRRAVTMRLEQDEAEEADLARRRRKKP